MKYTENMRLKKPDDSDMFDIADFNDNLDKLDEQCAEIIKAVDRIDSLTARLGGLSFINLPQIAYDNIIHDPSIVYFVTDDDGKVTMYLGDVKLTGGTE